MNRLIVSVVMVTCNVDRFLSEAIESILDQTLIDFEFIITDYGSTDRSKSIISRYEAKDRRIKSHTVPHCSLADARNAGCSRAKGKYIGIMDADDIALKDRLMWQVAFMEEHPDVGVLGGAVEWINSTGRSLLTLHNPVTDHEIRSALPGHCTLWQPTVLMRTEAFLSVGGYRGALAQAEDWDLWLRIAERFQLANLNEVVLKYRIHPNQISVRKLRQQTLCILAARAAAARKYGDSCPLAGVEEITPALLAELGVKESTQQTALAGGYLYWIHSMSLAGEHSSARTAATEFLRSTDRQHADRRIVAEIQLAAAGFFWRDKEFLSSFLSICQAVMTRPMLIGRPLKLLLRSLSPTARCWLVPVSLFDMTMSKVAEWA